MTGKFITFEGGEGTGKSTQIRRLADRLGAAGVIVVVTREPGGTPTAEAIRNFVLSGMAEELGARGEAALMAAARADHVERVIRPALAAGKWVLCDRFIDSTSVYQGATGGVDPEFLRALERVTVGRTRPDLTLILDLPAEEGARRMAARHAEQAANADRFERDDLTVQEARRRAFLDIAAREPGRCVVIDASPATDEVAAAVWRAVTGRLLQKAG
jgi:dTMP kinase